MFKTCKTGHPRTYHGTIIMPSKNPFNPDPKKPDTRLCNTNNYTTALLHGSKGTSR